METSNLLQIVAADPHELAITIFRLIHFLGLAVGLGSATLLDFIILRFLVLRRISRENRDIVFFGSRFIGLGLAMLWLSGAGFLASYLLTDPGLLANPKIWAKLAIVVVLSVNGLVIHKAVLPIIDAQMAKPLFDGLTRRRRTTMLVSGGLSIVSWYVPVILGATPQLNFVVPAAMILAIYAVAVAATVLFLHAAIAMHAASPSDPAMVDLPTSGERSTDPHARVLSRAFSQSDGGRLVGYYLDAALEEAMKEAETILRERIRRITLARLHAELSARKNEVRRAA